MILRASYLNSTTTKCVILNNENSCSSFATAKRKFSSSPTPPPPPPPLSDPSPPKLPSKYMNIARSGALAFVGVGCLAALNFYFPHQLTMMVGSFGAR